MDIFIEVLVVWGWKPRLLGRIVGVVDVVVSVSSFVGVLLIVLRLLIGMNMYRQVAWWLLAQVWLLRALWFSFCFLVAFSRSWDIHEKNRFLRYNVYVFQWWAELQSFSYSWSALNSNFWNLKKKLPHATSDPDKTTFFLLGDENWVCTEKFTIFRW